MWLFLLLFLLLLLSTSSVVVLQRICVALLCSLAPAPTGVRSPFHLHLPLRVLYLPLSLMHSLFVQFKMYVCTFCCSILLLLCFWSLLFYCTVRQADRQTVISVSLAVAVSLALSLAVSISLAARSASVSVSVPSLPMHVSRPPPTEQH